MTTENLNATPNDEIGSNDAQSPIEMNDQNQITDNLTQTSETTEEQAVETNDSIQNESLKMETTASEQPNQEATENIIEEIVQPVNVEELVLTEEPAVVEEISLENVASILEEEIHETSEISETEKASLAKLNAEELLAMAAKAADNENLSEAADEFRRIRKALDIISNKEFTEAKAKFLEEGGLPEDFKFSDPNKDKYHAYYKLFADRRDAFRKKQEEEKLKNVEIKKSIIEKVKQIAEGEETPNSIEQIKELQRQWKSIRMVPSELNEELWNNYQHFLNKFYDNRSINNELKELDRKKNLEVKIELCKRMDELTQEPSVKKVLIMHKKYWEDWKNTGPVPNEFREDLWSRFKEAADKVFNAKMEELKAMDAVRQENLDKKVVLCEKAEEFSRFESNSAKEWIAKVPEVQALFDEWKTIGMVSIRYQEEIWDRFKKAVNSFYHCKNEFFKNLDKKRQENLRKKMELCEKAEEIMNSEDWGSTTKELIRLQEEYKSWGPVPENMHEKIWNRFRKACDTFFERKSEHFASLEQDQNKNLEAKKDILTRLEELVTVESNEDLSNKVKGLQDEWNTYGFVPFKKKEEIGKRYKEVLDKIYQRIRKDFQQNNTSRTKNHYEVIARQSEGKNMLQGEERRLMDRIALLKKDMDTLQNNIGFFANSKSANQLLSSVNENIAATQKKIAQLQDQLRVLRGVKTGKPVEDSKPTVKEEPKEEVKTESNENENQ